MRRKGRQMHLLTPLPHPNYATFFRGITTAVPWSTIYLWVRYLLADSNGAGGGGGDRSANRSEF